MQPSIKRTEDMDDIKRKCRQHPNGATWFNRDSCRWFGTRFVRTGLTVTNPDGAFVQMFVTSEQMDYDHARGYTVRVVHYTDDGDGANRPHFATASDIGHLSPWQTCQEATAAMEDLARAYMAGELPAQPSTNDLDKYFGRV